jgi:ACS family tartrate transporter-like MFS transporter
MAFLSTPATEGIPAIVLGIVTVFYLTDWPAQAGWLPQDERDWLVNELQAELRAKTKIRNHAIMEAFCDLRILRLIFGYSWLSQELLEPSTGYRPS